MLEEESIVCGLCGKPICRSGATIGLLVMHYKWNNRHLRILESINEK